METKTRREYNWETLTPLSPSQYRNACVMAWLHHHQPDFIVLLWLNLMNVPEGLFEMQHSRVAATASERAWLGRIKKDESTDLILTLGKLPSGNPW